MRFSSVLLASLTVSAGLCWALPASAQRTVSAAQLDDLEAMSTAAALEERPSVSSRDIGHASLTALDIASPTSQTDGSQAGSLGLPEITVVDTFSSALPEPMMQWTAGVPRNTQQNSDTLWFAQADEEPGEAIPDGDENSPTDAGTTELDIQEAPEIPPPPDDVLPEETEVEVEVESDAETDTMPGDEIDGEDSPDEDILDEDILDEDMLEDEILEDDALDEDVGDEDSDEVQDEAVDDDVDAAEEPEEPRVLVAEVLVVGVEDNDLENLIYDTIETEPGRTTTRSQLQEDINAVFSTGFFSNVDAVPEDTPLGVRITFVVEPNPVLEDVEITNSALQEQGVTLTYEDPDAPFGAEPEQLTIQEIADRIFSPQYGETLNLLDFQAGIERLNQTYQANGYVLAQVVDAPRPDDGVVRLEVAEGVIEDIEVSFLDEDGLAVDEEGNPIEGRTRDFIITREFESQPGDVFNQQQIQSDLQEVFALGIFDDVRVALNPGDNPRQVDVIVNVIEGSTGSLAAGIGFSSASGLFGSASYQQQNLGGNNQRLGAEIQLGTRELLFDVRFTDPWIAGDPYQTSYTVNAFSRRSISLIFDGGDNEIELENGDRPRVQRIGGGVSFSRPLDEWLGWEGWRASTGLQFQRVSIRDADGDLTPEDEEGNDLSFSGTGRDDLFTLQLAAVRDRRNSNTQPTRGSLFRIGTEQSIPVGTGSILFNRVRASYSRYFPVSFTNFADGPEALAFNVQAGTVVGDLPPYEAFSLGGTDSVRGYDSGDLGSGRSFFQATAEYRFPVFAIVGGALFVDFGTDLGTADDVPGEPAEIRDKPGTGFGYGLGVRVQSPLGPIRVDYGFNDEGDSRIHFGIGERF